MNRAAAVLVALLTLLVATVSCDHILSDNGVHLGMAILAGAEQLRASSDLEQTVVFERLVGSRGPYRVTIGAQTPEDQHPYLSVSGSRGGGTTCHLRAVTVPMPLSIEKPGGTTEVVLRKNGEAIEVAALH